jgi:4-hydroxybenzoyl-CoA reductase subunit beta
MLRLNRFQFLSPSSVAEAVSLLAQHGDDAALMAGGTDLLVNIKHRVATPSYVIGVRGLPELQGITPRSDGGMDIGASVTLARIERDPTIAQLYPALEHAAHTVSAPPVRTAATIGGNICLDVRCNYYNQSYEWRRGIGFCMKKDSPICRVAPGGDRCWAVTSADTVPVLIALRAEVSIAGPGGPRRIPIEDLYADDGLEPHRLQRGEIVTAVHLPPPENWRAVYRKFRIRGSFDFPLAAVACALDLDATNTVRDVRIILTAVSTAPERAGAAEALLRGYTLDEEHVAAAGSAIFRLAKPMDNTAGTIFHRKRMARVLTERALRDLAGDAREAAIA